MIRNLTEGHTYHVQLLGLWDNHTVTREVRSKTVPITTPKLFDRKSIRYFLFVVVVREMHRGIARQFRIKVLERISRQGLVGNLPKKKEEKRFSNLQTRKRGLSDFQIYRQQIGFLNLLIDVYIFLPTSQQAKIGHHFFFSLSLFWPRYRSCRYL